MNSKKSILLTAAAICLLVAPIAIAGARGQHSMQRPVTIQRPSLTTSQTRVAVPSKAQPIQQPTPLANNTRHHDDRDHHDWRHWRHHHHHHIFVDNFFFGGFGYPYYRYGYGYGYPYYTYGYDPADYVDAAPIDASLVVQVQRSLARAGYYRGAIDGVIGTRTRSAVRAYERSHHLPVDGVIDDDLLTTMGLA